jgi:RNA polymerase sigma-70 factor, ECF subfamily
MSQDHTNAPRNRERSDAALVTLSDDQLMVEVQQGNGDAFTVLFDRYHRLVLVTALKIVRDVGEAQEVTQNVFFEFYRCARRFDPARGTLKVWLLQFAYHRSINRRNYLLLRQFYNRPDLEEASTWEATEKSTPRLPAPEIKLLIEEVMEVLSESQRRVIHKVIFEGLTMREISVQEHESLSSVRNHYYRGLDRLRDCLDQKPPRSREGGIVPVREVNRGEA